MKVWLQMNHLLDVALDSEYFDFWLRGTDESNWTPMVLVTVQNLSDMTANGLR
jgi:hypothetical protein